MAAPQAPADALDAEWARYYRQRIHRTPAAVRAVLAELLERPGRSTSEVGDVVGVYDQPNASRTLGRLEVLGLVYAEEAPQPRGGRPHRLWRLTAAGRNLAQLAGRDAS